MNGKGSKPRPLSVSQEEFSSNWDAIFGKKKPESANQSDENFFFLHPSEKRDLNTSDEHKAN